MTTADLPLFTIDVWEHAYYIDYRNARQQFVQTILDNVSNWKFASDNYGY
jgi:Fe-Mn family superoxide dismutase